MTKPALILVSFLLTSCLIILFSFKMKSIETPEYQIIKKIGEVEIRLYPKLTVAKTSLPGKSYKANSNMGFRTIAHYIFGGNASKQKIAMTAPVVMEMGDSASMYFVMPRKYTKEQLPRPSSDAVQIGEENEKTLAVIRFGGYSDDAKIENHCRQLEATLKESGIQTQGSFLYMGYNAPWDFVNRRNEVAIEVELL